MINDYFKTLISLTDNLYLVGGSVRDYLLKTNWLPVLKMKEKRQPQAENG